LEPPARRRTDRLDVALLTLPVVFAVVAFVVANLL
jgi:hypothetical protein